MKSHFSTILGCAMALGILSIPGAAQRFGQRSAQSNMPPSWSAITPGSIQAAGGPTGPVNPRTVVTPRGIQFAPNGVPFRPGHRRPHHRGRFNQGFVGYGVGYAPYYVEPGDYDQTDTAPAAEQERPGLTVFEHNWRPENSANLGEQPWSQPSTRAAAEPLAPPADEKPGPTTVLVFRDGHQQEIQNYAILGDRLIVLNEQLAKKIPLADLDLDATVKVNEDRGVEFKLPSRG